MRRTDRHGLRLLYPLNSAVKTVTAGRLARAESHRKWLGEIHEKVIVVRPEDPINVRIDDQNGIVVLTINGDLGMASTQAFKCAISEALQRNPTAFVIDLSAVQYLSSAGISVLVEAQNRFGNHELFAVVASGPMTGRILQMLELGDLLSVHETVDKALAAVATG